MVKIDQKQVWEGSVGESKQAHCLLLSAVYRIQDIFMESDRIKCTRYWTEQYKLTLFTLYLVWFHEKILSAADSSFLALVWCHSAHSKPLCVTLPNIQVLQIRLFHYGMAQFVIQILILCERNGDIVYVFVREIVCVCVCVKVCGIKRQIHK